MREVLRRLWTSPPKLALAGAVALGYAVLYQVALTNLTVGGTGGSASWLLVPGWEELLWRRRGPFQFEAVAVLELPFLVWLASPVDLAIGLGLGALTGAQVALVRIARGCAVSCGLSPATGVLAGLPGLLGGSACCAPLLFLLLGIPLTASLITLMGLMIPVAFVLLLIGLVLTLRVAARHCGEAPA